MKYFLYSAQQLNFRKQMAKKIGKNFLPGHVIINGLKKPFTEIVDDPKKSRFSDSMVVVYGDETTLKYTLPGAE